MADDVGAAVGIGGHPIHLHAVFGLVGALPQQEAVRVEFPSEDDAGGVVADRVDVVEAVDIHHLAGEVVGRRPDDLRSGGRGLRARGSSRHEQQNGEKHTERSGLDHHGVTLIPQHFLELEASHAVALPFSSYN